MEWFILLLVLVLVVIYFINYKDQENFRGGGGGGRGGGGRIGMGMSGGGGFGDYGNVSRYSERSNNLGLEVLPTYGFNRHVGLPITNSYADTVAYDLQNPFPSVDYEEDNQADGYEDAPWNPYTYREVMEPDGQIIGNIVPN